MLSLLTPHLQLDNVLQLTPGKFQELGRPGLLLDVDCTLKDHGAKHFPEPVIGWLSELRKVGALPCIVSNGLAERIEALARSLNVPYIARALKPFPFGCQRALQAIGVQPTQACIIGDQIFADILAGRLAGVYSILVRPTSPIEPWFTRVKRPLERVVLRRIRHAAPAELLQGAP